MWVSVKKYIKYPWSLVISLFRKNGLNFYLKPLTSSNNAAVTMHAAQAISLAN